MDARERLRADLGAVLAGPGGARGAADRLCRACVDLLDVDGAAVSSMYAGKTQGTVGSSGALSRRLDGLQFSFGAGPCLDAVKSGRPVLVGQLQDAHEQRWPGFTSAVLTSGIKAVYALPVAIARTPVGALDLFCDRPGPLSEAGLDGGLWAAELAALPLLSLMTAPAGADAAGHGDDGWVQLASLERVEVYQATGMIIGQLDVDAAEALVRLRAYAFRHGSTVSEAAWAIVERRVLLTEEESFRALPDASDGGRP